MQTEVPTHSGTGVERRVLCHHYDTRGLGCKCGTHSMIGLIFDWLFSTFYYLDQLRLQILLVWGYECFFQIHTYVWNICLSTLSIVSGEVCAKFWADCDLSTFLQTNPLLAAQPHIEHTPSSWRGHNYGIGNFWIALNSTQPKILLSWVGNNQVMYNFSIMYYFDALYVEAMRSTLYNGNGCGGRGGVAIIKQFS